MLAQITGPYIQCSVWQVEQPPVRIEVTGLYPNRMIALSQLDRGPNVIPVSRFDRPFDQFLARRFADFIAICEVTNPNETFSLPE